MIGSLMHPDEHIKPDSPNVHIIIDLLTLQLKTLLLMLDCHINLFMSTKKTKLSDLCNLTCIKYWFKLLINISEQHQTLFPLNERYKEIMQSIK